MTGGDPATLEYTVAGTPELKTKWLKNGKPLGASKKYRISFKNNVAQLKFYAAEIQDSGEYTFEVANDVGRSSCTATFTVLGWYPSCGEKQHYAPTHPHTHPEGPEVFFVTSWFSLCFASKQIVPFLRSLLNPCEMLTVRLVALAALIAKYQDLFH